MTGAGGGVAGGPVAARGAEDGGMFVDDVDDVDGTADVGGRP
ncbi:hypothetical protein [Streptomyces sp. NPDC101132]